MHYADCLSRDLYLKCINNLREVRRDTPDSPSRRNTTAHFFFCWWIYSSSLNLQNQIDQKRKPGGEMWKWDFGKMGGGANSKNHLQRENIVYRQSKLNCEIRDVWNAALCFWTMGGKWCRGNRTQPKVLRYQCCYPKINGMCGLYSRNHNTRLSAAVEFKNTPIDSTHHLPTNATVFFLTEEKKTTMFMFSCPSSWEKKTSINKRNVYLLSQSIIWVTGRRPNSAHVNSVFM